MLHYDLDQLFDHPWKFRPFIPSTIVTFGGQPQGQQPIRVRYRVKATADEVEDVLLLTWDVDRLRHRFSEIDEEIDILLTRDQDRAKRTELAAAVVAAAVMAHVAPGTKFTQRAGAGSGHDFYLNESYDEMIEVAGRWAGGLNSLFEEKRAQSDQNALLRRRWVSVTVMSVNPRNRTEGLHQ
jgi:hypothetical protein